MPSWLVSVSGEIGTKQTGTQKMLRQVFGEHLSSRIKSAGEEASIREIRGRYLVQGEGDLESLLLSQFGIGKVARLYAHLPLDIARWPWEELLPKRVFTYVVYWAKGCPLDFIQLVKPLKAALLSYLETQARERLKSWDNHPPERLEFYLAPGLEKGSFWVLVNPVPGPGGFPVDQGQPGVLVLFSGGPDSLLAAYLLGRRGQNVALLFLDDGAPGRWQAVSQAAKHLAYFFPAQTLTLWRMPYQKALETIFAKAPKRSRCLWCKQTMLLLAAAWARKNGFHAVATGEILGEQASQTLPALKAYDPDGVLLLRPVLAFTKEEVLARLKALGLKNVAQQKLPPCGYAPKHPRTQPKEPLLQARALFPKIKKLCLPPQKVVLSWGRRSL